MDSSLTVRALSITDADFERIVREDPELSFEQTSIGQLVIVPPTGGTSGKKNLSLLSQFGSWVEQNLELGEGFDSSTLFVLPSGAKRSPDAAWVARERWNVLTRKEQDGYPPLCPDFVIELRSPSDSLEELQAKMQEYIDNGVRLGWLINPADQQVEIYRSRQNIEVLKLPITLSGEDILPGFMLKCDRLFA